MTHSVAGSLDEVARLMALRYDEIQAQRDAAVNALAAVMSTLRAVAGSPEEQRIHQHARAVLVECGYREERAVQYGEDFKAWEARRR